MSSFGGSGTPREPLFGPYFGVLSRLPGYGALNMEDVYKGSKKGSKNTLKWVILTHRTLLTRSKSGVPGSPNPDLDLVRRLGPSPLTRPEPLLRQNWTSHSDGVFIACRSLLEIRDDPQKPCPKKWDHPDLTFVDCGGIPASHIF